MKSRKLKQDEKRVFTRKIVTDKTKESYDSLAEKGKVIFNDFYTEFLKKYGKQFNTLPKDFFFKADSISMHYDKAWGSYIHVILDEEVHLPYRYYDRGDAKIRVEHLSNTFIKRLSNLDTEKKLVNKYGEELTQELNKLFHSCNTTKQLVDAFPEIKEYIELEDSIFYPPVANTTKLKELLNQK